MGDSIASECSPLLKMQDAQAKEGVQAQGNLRQRQQDRGHSAMSSDRAKHHIDQHQRT